MLELSSSASTATTTTTTAATTTAAAPGSATTTTVESATVESEYVIDSKATDKVSVVYIEIQNDENQWLFY